MHLVVLLSYFKLSIFITLVPHWINMIGLMSTKICQSSRIIISPYCLYHDIMCMRTDWSERWRECQKSRSSAAQSKMLIKISKSNTCMAAWMETTESKNVYQICQSSRIIISPIVFINTLYVYWRIGVTGGVSSRSRAAQSKMFIKISESNTYMSEWRQQCSPKEKCF